jgi:hypothetical protein
LGKLFTVTVTVFVFAQPFAAVPVTVYVVVTVGVSATVEPVTLPGFQVYVLAPLAVNVALVPEQTVAVVAGETVNVGGEITLMAIVRLLGHPQAFVAMHVYVVFVVGLLTVTTDPVVALRKVEGVHVYVEIETLELALSVSVAEPFVQTVELGLADITHFFASV